MIDEDEQKQEKLDSLQVEFFDIKRPRIILRDKATGNELKIEVFHMNE